MKWRPYPKYKPSGVGWLGDVPEHWEVKRLKYIFWLQRGHDLAVTEFHEGQYPVYGSNGCIGHHNQFTTKGPGVTVGRSGSVGEVNYINSNFWAHNTALYVKKFRQTIPRFSFYLLKTLDVKYLSAGTAVGTLNRNNIHALQIAIPPRHEQTAIADFLDRETGRIDSLVVKKQTLIERLKEKRTALISRTVTRGLPPDEARKAGLDPFPRLKPSGVEWLGDVPEGWEVKSIKRLTTVQRGASPRPIDNEIYFDDNGEYSWVRISDVTIAGMYLTSTTQRLSELGCSFSVPLEPGTLFLSIAGSVGKPCITKIKCCIHDGFVYFPHWRGEARFLYYVFASGEPYKGLGKLGTQLNLNTDTVGSILVGIPDKREQTAIADFLDRETAKIDRLIAKIETAIERLREYRTALITAAVTGKIDVRRKAA